VIDPHHHLWDLSKVRYPWLLDDDKTSFFGSFESIASNYLPEDYLQDCGDFEVSESVHIQAEADSADPVAETRWLSDLKGPVPSAIVVYADFRQDKVNSLLDAHCEFEKVRGVRQILNYHDNTLFTYTDENLLENPAWLRNFAIMARYNLSFDLQIYASQMADAARLAAKYPSIQFILNHTGMPVDREEAGVEEWRKGMQTLATCPNIAVKISGLGMTDPNWTTKSIRPFVLETIDYFGIDRCMFASNFPVDRLFSDFSTLFLAFQEITVSFSSDEKTKLFHNNAAMIYKI
jgi:predicted TIM-barrel fold metal-dependent hydrolase